MVGRALNNVLKKSHKTAAAASPGHSILNSLAKSQQFTNEMLYKDSIVNRHTDVDFLHLHLKPFFPVVSLRLTIQILYALRFDQN